MEKTKKKQNFFKRHFKAIATAGIIAIPTIYTSFFLGSMWDPYGNTGNLPVAVVNNDRAVIYKNDVISVGERLVEKLEDNDSLAFNFVDADVAEKGLENGTYYMVITIPEDFSENAVTVLDDEPKKMVLGYAVNPGTNYIASKMSESAMVKLQKSVEESVIEEYTNTVFESLDTIGSGMDEAAEGAGKLKDGSGKISEGADTIKENLKLLADSTITFEEGASALNDGIKEYTKGVSDVNEGASKLSEGAVSLKDGAGSLSEGASKLSDGLKTYTDGVSAVNDGAEKLASGAAELSGGTSVLSSGAGNLQTGLKTYTGGVSDVNSGAKVLSAGAAQLKNGSEALLGGLNTVAGALDSSMSEENINNINTVRNGLVSLNSGIQELNKTLQESDTSLDMSALVTTLSISLNNISTDTKSIGSGLENMSSSMTALMSSEAFRVLPAEQQAALSKQMTDIMQNLAANTSDIGTNLKNISQSMTEADLGTKAASYNTSMTALKTSVGTIAENSEKLMPGAGKVITSLSDGLSNVRDALERRGENAAETGLIQGAETLDAGIAQICSGSSTLYAGTSQLVSNNETLMSGISSISEGAKVLDGGASALKDGTSDLLKGTKKLDSGSETLTEGAAALDSGAKALDSGAGELKNGINTLKDGTDKLVSNSGKLVDGSAELYDGSSKIRDGSSQLYDGSSELSGGVSELYDGCETLESSLADGAAEINEKNKNEKNAQMFSAPVDIEETILTNPKNNGQAMSAYMMSVGLWVGCLAYCLMFSPDEAISEKKITRKNAVHYWLQEMAKVLVIAAVQAVVMVFVLSGALGFEPANAVKTISVACMSSMAFMMLFWFFNLLMGKIGSFILLVFMVLQLSGAAGTYPIELSDSFYQKLHPFMPFTYTVNAFRSTIASGLDISKEIKVLCGIFIVFWILNFAAVYLKSSMDEKEKIGSIECTE